MSISNSNTAALVEANKNAEIAALRKQLNDARRERRAHLVAKVMKTSPFLPADEVISRAQAFHDWIEGAATGPAPPGLPTKRRGRPLGSGKKKRGRPARAHSQLLGQDKAKRKYTKRKGVKYGRPKSA